jgi:thiamine-monophosphate kinase
MSYERLIQQIFPLLSEASDAEYHNYDSQAATLLTIERGEHVVTALNTMIEGVHFLADYEAAALAYKAVVASYSKLMAVGAKPICFQCNISIPEIKVPWLKAFSAGLQEASSQYGGVLSGVTLVTGKRAIAVSAVGKVHYPVELSAKQEPRAGDLIYVTGTLGDAGLALQRILQQIPNDDSVSRYLEQCLLRPTIPLEFARALYPQVTSCIELAAGFTQDLQRILGKARLGANIALENIPLSSQIQTIIERQAAYQYALNGGDDYQLCFTIRAEQREVIARVAERYEISVSCVGTLSDEAGIRVTDTYGKPFVQKTTDHDHFATIDFDEEQSLEDARD